MGMRDLFGLTQEVQMGLGARVTLALLASASVGSASDPVWDRIEKSAKGQTVYFNAWAGSELINAYLKWAGDEVQKRYGVQVHHVKIADAAEVVHRIQGEKAAGRNTAGSVDALWVNGENFLSLKRAGLLHGPFSPALPNYRFVDLKGKPTTLVDFSEPVDGLEAPWGMAQLTFFADGTKVPEPPRSMVDLATFARRNPGRVSYSRPPDFHGTTFLKQALLETVSERRPLYRPVSSELFQSITAPLWAYLDALHPQLWRKGRQFPANVGAMQQMLADGELLVSFSFNPNHAANAIAGKQLPPSVRSFQFPGGTIGNTHFIAIPYNSSAKEGAQVFINFLLSPEAQARKADIRYWGDPTVLSAEQLSSPERAAFSTASVPGSVTAPAPPLDEPHASWVQAIEQEWLKRYGQ